MIEQSNSRDTTRARLLAAATQIVRTKGATALTLAATAKQAGVSKGGLLYHFPSKEALITAMIEEVSQTLLNEVEQLRVQYASQPGSSTQAIITHTERNFSAPSNQLVGALIAAIGNNPAMLEPARKMTQQRFAALRNEGIPFEIAAIANLATDGLWFMELLGIEPLNADERVKIFQALRELVNAAS